MAQRLVRRKPATHPAAGSGGTRRQKDAARRSPVAALARCPACHTDLTAFPIVAAESVHHAEVLARLDHPVTIREYADLQRLSYDAAHQVIDRAAKDGLIVRQKLHLARGGYQYQLTAQAPLLALYTASASLARQLAALQPA